MQGILKPRDTDLPRSVTFTQVTQLAQSGFPSRHGIPPIGIPNDQNPKKLLVMGTHGHRKFIFSTS